MSGFSSIEVAIQEIKEGKMIIVVDDEDRENEGDLVMAAQHVTARSVNFMTQYGRGLICVPMEKERLEKLSIFPMVRENTDTHQTAFTVSVDAVGTHTGISAYERAETIRMLVDPEATPGDFKKPGHVFPLAAKAGGVLKRAGHTEASVDLARMAGCKPAGVICEIMNEDGSMARVPELLRMSEKFGFALVTIEDLIAYRRKNEIWVENTVEANLPTKYGEFRVYGYSDLLTGEHHVALVKGSWKPDEPVLVRVHSECLTGDALGSLRCDCGEQYEEAMKKIEENGKGVLLYMRQEGRGIGLVNKLKAYELQDRGYDTVDANLELGFAPDLREYGVGAQILSDLGVRKMRLMTNNPGKIKGLAGHGLDIVERVPIQMSHNEKNRVYLECKKNKMGHMLQKEEEVK